MAHSFSIRTLKWNNKDCTCKRPFHFEDVYVQDIEVLAEGIERLAQQSDRHGVSEAYMCLLPATTEDLVSCVYTRAQEMESLREEFQDSQADIMEKYEQLQGDHDDLLLRYERRESREEDLARIRVLEAECAECGNKVKKAEEDMKFYKVKQIWFC